MTMVAYPYGRSSVQVAAFRKPAVLLDRDQVIQIVLDFLPWKGKVPTAEWSFLLTSAVDEGPVRVPALRSIVARSDDMVRWSLVSRFPEFASFVRTARKFLKFWGEDYDMRVMSDSTVVYRWHLRGRGKEDGWGEESKAALAALAMEMVQSGFIYAAASPAEDWVAFLHEYGIRERCRIV